MAHARPVRIRLSTAALIVPAMLLLCTFPIATAGGTWSLAYAIPAVALLVVLYAGVTATGDALIVRWWRGRVRIGWAELDRLEFPGQRWAVAVTASGRRVVLPGVRPVDVPRIVAAAGGTLLLGRDAPAAEQEPDGQETDGQEPDGQAAAPAIAAPAATDAAETAESDAAAPGTAAAETAVAQ